MKTDTRFSARVSRCNNFRATARIQVVSAASQRPNCALGHRSSQTGFGQYNEGSTHLNLMPPCRFFPLFYHTWQSAAGDYDDDDWFDCPFYLWAQTCCDKMVPDYKLFPACVRVSPPYLYLFFLFPSTSRRPSPQRRSRTYRERNLHSPQNR